MITTTAAISTSALPDLFDVDRLRALPERASPDLPQSILPAVVRLDRGEVIGRELADLRGGRAGAIREEDLALTDAAGIQREHPGRRMRRVVLVVDARAEVAVRDPGRLARPAAMDQLRIDRQHPPDGLDRLRRLRLPAGAKV